MPFPSQAPSLAGGIRVLRAAGALALRKFFGGDAGSCRSACASIFSMFTRIAGSPTTWVMKLAIAAASLQLLDEWEARIECLLRGRSPASRCSWRWPERCANSTFPSRICRSADRFSSGPEDHALRNVSMICLDIADILQIRSAIWCLYLCGYRDAERQQLSDFTCTALQLANFWQDVSADYEKGTNLSAAGGLAPIQRHRSGHRWQQE